ncbi:MAG TPA: HlyD family secretion protein [Opitutaceae bacterium]|nr:HlyD family secretion protein [Opitutaceae bacterium]
MNTTEVSGVPAAPARRPGGDGNGRRRIHLWIGIGVIVTAAVAIAGYWFFVMRGTVYTDDARIGGYLVDLAPEINGRIAEIRFREGAAVRRNDVVFQLDSADAQAAIGESEAALLAARATLVSDQAKYDKAVHGSRPEEIRAAEAVARRLQNEEELARVSLERTELLFKQGSAAQDELDRARTAFESARQSRENAAQTLLLLRQGSRPEDIESARADVDVARSRVAQAAAALERARVDLDHCSVRAPFDGWVVRRWLDAGAITPPSQPVVTLFDPSTLRVDANIEEKYLHQVSVGDQADITVDAFPGLKLKGRVREILRATNSQFSLIPAEGVSGTFIKVTQRVPLRISVETPPELPIGPGLSVEVRIRVGTSGVATPGQHADR